MGKKYEAIGEAFIQDKDNILHEEETNKQN